ncbi:MAG: trypsin-like peptidase domain-containing protein [Actinomycetota bacterium]|nr:trypsin-like peptidase domain-containing protein [Actinomycetota bacterium]
MSFDRRRDSARRRVGPALTAVLLAALALALAACSAAPGGPGDAATAGRQLRAVRSAGGYQQVIGGLLPSVVEITAGSSTGSGVVFDSQGDIVTNEHVVGNAKSFEVRTSTLSAPLPAHLVGRFAPDDLAVIRVTRDARMLRPARWASPAQIQVGAIVLAMGSPYGLVDSVTEGIVSATGRTVTGPEPKGQLPAVIVGAIQTSAAINPGNSGGALALVSGQVIGIPTLSATDPELGGAAPGIGFAIPASTVISIASQLIRSGKVTRSGRATLGVTGQTYTASGSAAGVTVDQAPADSPAAKAGIRAGDVIAGVDGQLTPTVTELELVLAGLRPGQRVAVEILRGGNPRQVTATLGALRS